MKLIRLSRGMWYKSKKFWALKILNVRNCRALSFNYNSNMKASNAVVSKFSVAVSYSSPRNSVPRSIIW